MNRYEGGCLCGICRYVITTSEPYAMYLCHCSRCRKETGSIHGANVFFKTAQLMWEKGRDNVTYFELEGTRKQRTFCKTCGSPLPMQNRDGHVVMPAGTLDEDNSLIPTAHIFYASRASWEDNIKNLKQFDELPNLK